MSNYKKLSVNTSTNISFCVQVVVIFISVHGLILAYDKSVSSENSIRRQQEFAVLFDLLALETFFQAIEFVFYAYFVFHGIDLNEMALTRYYDWFFTTPAMLISFAYYFAYLNGYRERLNIFVRDNFFILTCIVISNFFMLLIGYICELKKLQSCNLKMLLQSVGFFCLIVTFSLIYNFAQHTVLGHQIFLVTFIIWFFYGIAFSMNNTIKNTMYNILDLFSKNFFSFFVYANIVNKAFNFTVS